MASTMQPRLLSETEVEDLVERVPEFAAALHGDPVDTPPWLVDRLAAARARRR
jgi:hypothetical protein